MITVKQQGNSKIRKYQGDDDNYGFETNKHILHS